VRPAGILLALLLAPAPALSASRVAVLDPVESDTMLAEAVVRLRAELASAGFEVVRAAGSATGDVRANMEQVGPEPAPLATLAIVRAEGATAIDVWVVDRVSGKTSVRRVEALASSEIVPSALAIRAVDLLRASLLEAALPGRTPTKEVPADLATLLPAPVPPRWPAGAGLGLGIGVLHSFAGLGPAVTPVVRFSLGVAAQVALRVELAGPAFGASAQSRAGVAAVRQELANVGMLVVLKPGAIQPFLSAAFGAYHVHATGDANPPNTGKSGDAWALVGAASGGLAVQIGSNSALLAEVEGVVTFPGVAVDVGGAISGRAGRPSILASLGPSWSF